MNLLEAFRGSSIIFSSESLHDVISEDLVFLLELTNCSENRKSDELFMAKDGIFSVGTFDFVCRNLHRLLVRVLRGGKIFQTFSFNFL